MRKTVKSMSEILDKLVPKMKKKIEEFINEITEINNKIKIENIKPIEEKPPKPKEEVNNVIKPPSNEDIYESAFQVISLDLYDEDILDYFEQFESEYFDCLKIIGNALKNKGLNKLFEVGGEKWKKLKYIDLTDNSLNENAALETIIKMKLPNLKRVKVGKNSIDFSP